MKLFSLEGKVALVTGALGLLGRAHCRALQMAGAQVVILDRDEEECRTFARELGENSLGLSINVTEKLSISNSLKQILRHFDRLDILINNAAVNDRIERPELAAEDTCFENYSEAAWREMIDVNVTGVFLCSQVFGSYLAKRRSGSIINIASTYGVVAPDQSLYRDENGKQWCFKSAAYPTSKGAVLAFTRYLAAYWGNTGVRVNSLSPGGVANGQKHGFVERYAKKTPLGRMAIPEDYAGALVFLASDASSYMTGANLVVDGGWTTW